jgi:hypothetical protein
LWRIVNHLAKREHEKKQRAELITARDRNELEWAGSHAYRFAM